MWKHITEGIYRQQNDFPRHAEQHLSGKMVVQAVVQARNATRQTLTWLGVQSAGSEEVGSEVDVNIAEEEQHVLAAPPCLGTHLEAPTTRELFIQLDQCKTPEPGLPEWTKCSCHFCGKDKRFGDV